MVANMVSVDKAVLMKISGIIVIESVDLYRIRKRRLSSALVLGEVPVSRDLGRYLKDRGWITVGYDWQEQFPDGLREEVRRLVGMAKLLEDTERN